MQPINHWPKALQSDDLKPLELTSIQQLKASVSSEANAQKIALGKQLFFDPRLSQSNQIACASCHDPQQGWADGKRRAFGHDRQQGKRNSMSLMNAAFSERFFWDGRAISLEQQALMPIQDPVEMHAKLDETLGKLNQITGYRQTFADIYANKQADYQISSEHLGDALASFERTLVSKPSRFDRFVEGDYQQLNQQEIHGLHLFRTKARCIQCHQGALFSDNRFHNTGLSYFGRKYQDLGLYDTTGKEADKGKFKTPSLRELKHTGPYMHNGLFPTLSGVLRMYNGGITYGKKLKPGEPALSPLIQPLHLTEKELQDLEAFLLTLSSKTSRYVAPPDLPN
ncbi:cytochrome c peroxidase [Thiomicrorhabdus heinhorstiae]|uniref:Cytochrome-c peroxidase n=1 Tax=Thiomicrorhabdus heinhorstiae TaxID=2748010 RepID=A0ABS0BW84_9GAMM|nr:cytochrome c peroxidase [Thiomicrorhabdus heinhorstiae]MBF6057338.1 cytochrome-c peroxidase [Thiomicrorhabdus heinhorstiae]